MPEKQDFSSLADIVERALVQHLPVPLAAELGVDFDEAWYVRSNADIARAVDAGRCPSPLLHYLRHGHLEGRLPVSPNGESTMPQLYAGTDPEDELSQVVGRHTKSKFLCPSDLRQTPVAPLRLLLVGSCYLNSLGFENSDFAGKCRTEFLMVNNLSQLPDQPNDDPSCYDIQLVQIPLRSVMPDALLWHIPLNDTEQYTVAFDAAVLRLEMQLKSLLAWNVRFGIPTLVMNFMVAQGSAPGRLLPRYDLQNPAFFIEQLNRELERLLRGYKNVYLFDIDQIAASFGRRYVQDDLVVSFSHNASIPATREILDRIEPLAPMSDHYELLPTRLLRDAVWEELVAMHRTIRQVDAVKLVVVDLDDTLWAGVSGEMGEVGPEMLEGWPLGVVEALAYLKKRGLLLAIISKNDDERIASRWDDILRGRLRLTDFASRRINWLPKPVNMGEILADVNLLPRNVLYIDDSPIERKAMKQAYPDMRVIGRHPYYLRRILLWSPETQVAAITDEAGRRTELIHAQITRERLRKQISRDDFLRSLDLKVKLFTVDEQHPRYQRAFELLNKTNQFNTTGKRWRAEELSSALAMGLELYAFEVNDHTTAYGLVGLLLIDKNEIVQFVMSCRVVGLDVEIAVLAALIDELRARGGQVITARFAVTDANLLCRDLFPRLGFHESESGWTLVDSGPDLPGHLQLTMQTQMLSLT